MYLRVCIYIYSTYIYICIASEICIHAICQRCSITGKKQVQLLLWSTRASLCRSGGLWHFLTRLFLRMQSCSMSVYVYLYILFGKIIWETTGILQCLFFKPRPMTGVRRSSLTQGSSHHSYQSCHSYHSLGGEVRQRCQLAGNVGDHKGPRTSDLFDHGSKPSTLGCYDSPYLTEKRAHNHSHFSRLMINDLEKTKWL